MARSKKSSSSSVPCGEAQGYVEDPTWLRKIIENPQYVARNMESERDFQWLKDVLPHPRNVRHLMEIQQLMEEFDGQEWIKK